jgi:hypothetical protein
VWSEFQDDVTLFSKEESVHEVLFFVGRVQNPVVTVDVCLNSFLT